MPEFALRTKLEPPFGNHHLQTLGKNKKTHKHNFHGIVPKLSRDCPGPGTIPEISWEFCLCVSLFPQGKGKRINNLTPTHFQDNPAKLSMFIGFFLRLKLDYYKARFARSRFLISSGSHARAKCMCVSLEIDSMETFPG